MQAHCWSQSYSISDCALTDISCQCGTKQAITYVSHCVVDNCTLADSIGLCTRPLFQLEDKTEAVSEISKAWALVCDRPHDNQYVRMRAAAIGSGVAAFLMVACRMLARMYTVRRFWWDDWCHIMAGVCCRGGQYITSTRLTLSHR